MQCSNTLVAGLLLALAARNAARGQVLLVDHVADSLQAALVARAIDLPPRLAALDSLNGFGPYRFGTPVAELPEPLTRLEVLKHDWVHFYVPTAVANVEGLVLPGWQLAAYGGRLAGIGFAPTSPQYGEALLALLQARFGPGRCTGYQRYEWRGRVITLVYEPLVGGAWWGGVWLSGGSYRDWQPIRGTVYLRSNALLAEEQAAHRRRRQK